MNHCECNRSHYDCKHAAIGQLMIVFVVQRGFSRSVGNTSHILQSARRMAVEQLFFRCSAGFLAGHHVAGLVIRPADQARGAESIIRLAESAHGDGFAPIRATGLLAELGSRPGRKVESWLALLDGTPAGLVELASGSAGLRTRHSLPWLLVSRHARRQGIATALVNTALESARDQGATEVWVETRSDWPAATAFWTAIGFRPAD